MTYIRVYIFNLTVMCMLRIQSAFGYKVVMFQCYKRNQICQIILWDYFKGIFGDRDKCFI